jgi:2'-5' RNA ligase
MKYFIGVVPPEDIYNTVLNIQQQFGDNRIEPHITVRPPVTVTNEAGWISAIEQVCQRFSPISIQLPKTGSFGKRVLFIDVESSDLARLHYSIMEAINPFEKPEMQQDQTFHPHLTLGRSWRGFTYHHFTQMKILADEYLSSQKVFFQAKSVRIYQKSESQGRYKNLKDVMLADDQSSN